MGNGMCTNQYCTYTTPMFHSVLACGGGVGGARTCMYIAAQVCQYVFTILWLVPGMLTQHNLDTMVSIIHTPIFDDGIVTSQVKYEHTAIIHFTHL